jgi:uncharacterized protein YndB with AHSA1/START domain
MVASRSEAKAAADLEVVITRVIDAPRALVFQAWIEPQQLARWFGPDGFTNACEVSPRVGGAYRIVMRSPDGAEYPITGVFREVVAPERIVCTQNLDEHPAAWHDDLRKRGADMPIAETLLTVTFEELGGKTKLTVRTRFHSAATLQAFQAMGMSEGWTQSLVRLEESAGAPGTADREIVNVRVVDAPPELVWEAWTNPKHVAHWWGPNGFTSTIQEMDVRPGGVWRFVMHGPDGTDYPNRIDFVEVVKPSRLVYDHGPEPLFHVTVTFAPQAGKTRVSMRGLFATAAERTLVAEKYGAIEGGRQHLARLGDYLGKL